MKKKINIGLVIIAIIIAVIIKIISHTQAKAAEPVHVELKEYAAVEPPVIAVRVLEKQYIPSEEAAAGYISEKELIEITEEVGGRYGICPELLQSIAFHESSYKLRASNGSCLGLMQVNSDYMAERMERLGVADIYDAYSNILLAADFIAELRDTTANGHDLYYVLMRYNMRIDTANELYEAGTISNYAISVAELAAELERLHGK